MILQHAPVGEKTPHEAGRQLLEKMYREQFGAPMPPILTGPRGKPYFQDNDVHFSITHTPNHAFCALDEKPIGIDAEELDRPHTQALAKRVLSEKEWAVYQRSPDKNQTFLRLWVLKEAQGKCTGQGISGFPNYTDFSPDDPRVTITHGCVLAVVQED